MKIRPDRDDDMVATGKRHDFHVAYELGFDDDGRIEAVDATPVRQIAGLELCAHWREGGGAVHQGSRCGACSLEDQLEA
ncbi:molybdopterin cofactor-binding domain-containing protein, partial [Klebsiella pneumoniae]|uniref:molybdopterin cofactor-binding domain-containing protein n=1 Tax=Klebsiella pneumoniae TaxID=573 RepID=UPI0034D3C522